MTLSGCAVKLSTAGPSADMSRGTASMSTCLSVCPSVYVPCVHAREPVSADPRAGPGPPDSTTVGLCGRSMCPWVRGSSPL